MNQRILTVDDDSRHCHLLKTYFEKLLAADVLEMQE